MNDNSALSRLMRSTLAMNNPLIYHWVSLYMQGGYSEDEVMYELVLSMHANMEILRRELVSYHMAYGALPQHKETTP